MGEYLPKFHPGDAITITASATLVGGQMITAAGAVAGADSQTWVGVASRDAVATDKVTFYSEGVQRLTSSAAIAQGALVKCAAAGQVVTWISGTDVPATLVGIALEAAGAANAVIAVKLYR